MAALSLCSQTTLIYLSTDNTLSFASVLCSQWNTHIHFSAVHLTRLFMPSTQFPWHYQLCIYVVYISTSCIGVAQHHFLHSSKDLFNHILSSKLQKNYTFLQDLFQLYPCIHLHASYISTQLELTMSPWTYHICRNFHGSLIFVVEFTHEN